NGYTVLVNLGGWCRAEARLIPQAHKHLTGLAEARVQGYQPRVGVVRVPYFLTTLTTRRYCRAGLLVCTVEQCPVLRWECVSTTRDTNCTTPIQERASHRGVVQCPCPRVDCAQDDVSTHHAHDV